jgi:hypothetical protein
VEKQGVSEDRPKDSKEFKKMLIYAVLEKDT